MDEGEPTYHRPSDDRPPDDAVLGFLRDHHGSEPADLELLTGGFWSAAWGYRIGGDELVLRLSSSPAGFRSDESAMAHGSPDLPVPEVLAIGEALGRSFAVSRRHHGRFLEEVGPEEADRLAPTVVRLLGALRSVHHGGEQHTPWREWLMEGLSDQRGHITDGWRQRIQERPAAARTLEEAERRLHSSLDACTDRGQLVHSDLLHHNVLVSSDADAVTGVFSWKCSTWGDAVFDLAWCTFWGRWHEGIGALDLFRRVVPTLSGGDAADVSVRHHAYELQIGAAHLGWYVTLGDQFFLDWTYRQLDELLERGPET